MRCFFWIAEFIATFLALVKNILVLYVIAVYIGEPAISAMWDSKLKSYKSYFIVIAL